MFELRKACDLPNRAEEQRWLIEDLWSEEAVGICGGEPKCCKSFLALAMAVSVASGRPCFGRFAVTQPGPVLLFAGEDALHEVRRRIKAIARSVGVDLDTLEVYVITTAVLRLDRHDHRAALEKTVASIKPRILILDPFVRLHRIDENVSAEVAPLLASLRDLQRGYHTSVMVVHHSRKGAGHARAGQALRGSSEFHAWGDSNLYLRRKDGGLWLTVEHRAAAAMNPIRIELSKKEDALALEIVSGPATTPTPTALPAAKRIELALTQSQGPMRATTLRKQCKIRTETLCEILSKMVETGRVMKVRDGFQLAQPNPS